MHHWQERVGEIRNNRDYEINATENFMANPQSAKYIRFYTR